MKNNKGILSIIVSIIIFFIVLKIMIILIPIILALFLISYIFYKLGIFKFTIYKNYNYQNYENYNQNTNSNFYTNSYYEYEKACEVLQVNVNDSFETKKKKRRELLKKYHPDLFLNENEKQKATEITNKINQAWQIIEDYENVK